MQHAIHVNPANKGALHRSMGIPEGRKLTMGDLMKTKTKAKATGDTKLEKRATFAQNASKWDRG